jgi:hypothetical protein
MHTSKARHAVVTCINSVLIETVISKIIQCNLIPVVKSNLSSEILSGMESWTVKLVFGTGCPDHQRQRVMPLPGTSNTSFSK